jgi:hypothetical protein
MNRSNRNIGGCPGKKEQTMRIANGRRSGRTAGKPFAGSLWTKNRPVSLCTEKEWMKTAGRRHSDNSFFYPPVNTETLLKMILAA